MVFAAAGFVITTGCGGGSVNRIAAEPAVRLDRPAPATPAAVRASVSFEEDSVSEERLDGGDADQQAGGPREDTTARRRPAPRREPAPPRQATTKDASSRKKPAAASASQRVDETEDEEDAQDDDAPVRHVLRRGQTLYSVARLYGVEVSALMKANGIANSRHVAANTSLVIPLPRPPRKAAAVTAASIVPVPGAAASGEPVPSQGSEPSGGQNGSTKKKGKGSDQARTASLPPLAWPIQGLITAPFGKRGKADHHEGIDIDGQTGDAIRAAASGTVVFAGTHGDYGRTVVIDHGDGLRTIYAHASILKVEEGDPVRVGDTIAEVGRSGNARGSHLHFEVRREGRAVNPIPYLHSSDLLTAGVIPTPRTKSSRHKTSKNN